MDVRKAFTDSFVKENYCHERFRESCWGSKFTSAEASVKASLEATPTAPIKKTSGHSVYSSRAGMEVSTETVGHVYLLERLDFHHRNEHAGERSRKTYIRYTCVANFMLINYVSTEQ